MNLRQQPAFASSVIAMSVLMAVLYFGTAQVGLGLAFPGSNASPVWPASGLALAALLHVGRAVWPGIWLGAFAANLYTFMVSGGLAAGTALPVSALIATGNLAEALIAWGVCRQRERARLFGTIQGAYIFTAAALLGASASAACGVSALLGFNVIPQGAGSTILAIWWLGDVVGLLVVAPFLLHLAPRRGPLGLRGLSSAGVFVAAGLVVFSGVLSEGHADRVASFLLPIAIAWCALRHGQAGAAFASFGVMLWAVVATLHGVGPFAKATATDSLVSMDVFLALCAVTGLLVAASTHRLTGAAGEGPPRAQAGWHTPVAILLAGLAGTILAWHLVARTTEREAAQELEALANGQQARVLERLRLYEQALRGARGLFDASSHVDRVEWHRYVDSLGLDESYPGVQGLGFTQRVAAADLAAHEAQIRAGGLPEYRIHPAPAERRQDEYTGIVYIEPVNERNRRALGYDMASEPVRRAAMERARDTGRTSVSGRVTLLQENGRDVQPGFLMYVPVYRPGMPTETEQQRRSALYGWVYSAFRMGDLMHGILNPGDLDTVALAIFDGARQDPEHLMYDSHVAEAPARYPDQASTAHEVTIGDHRWLAVWTTTPRFETGVDTAKAQTVLVAGAVISLLLFTVIRSLSDTRQQALALAARMRAAHEEAEDRFRSLAESANAAMLVINEQGTVEFCNGASTTLFGRAAEELQGVRLASLLGHHDTLSVAQAQLSSGYAPPAFEAMATRPDSETPVEVSLGSWMRDGRRYFSAIVLDISARKRAEAQVLRTKADLRAILDNMPAMVGSWGADQRNRFCNKEYQDWFGVDPASAQGLHIREVIGEQLYQQDQPNIDKVLEGRGVSFERVITSPNGRTRYAQTHYIPDLRDGIVQGFFVLVFDMTRQKEVEQALEYGLRLHDVIFTHAGVGIACTRERRFERVSRRFTELLGYEQGELDGQPAADIFPDAAAYAEVGRLAHELLPAGQTLDHELHLRRRDGTILWCRLMGRAVDPADESQGTIWIVDDFSDRKQRELLLEAAREAAESTARVKAQFLANMSHEIRTPMNAIIGLTRLTLDSDLDAMQRDNLQNVFDSGMSLLRLLDDILDYSKMEAGKLELIDEEFDLRDRLAAVLQGFAPAASAKGLDLVLDIAPDVPQRVRGDAGRLSQVVTNLCGNALKFTRAGHVACRVEVEQTPGDSVTLRFTVADTGIGIPEAQRARIFDSFVQADSSVTRQYGGTGLGLAICAQLVELMHGRIWVDSEAGTGSNFHFTASLAACSGPPEWPAHEARALQGMSVLVVIGNVAQRAAVLRLLGVWEVRAVVCTTVESAIAAARLGARHGAPYATLLVDARAWHEREPTAPETAAVQAGLTPVLLDGGGAGGGLRQPLRPFELRTALLHAAGMQPEAGVPAGTQGGTAARRRPQARAALQILAAEDHPVNQKLVARILSHHGHEVTVVGDGRQAVEAARLRRFDVILMDMQMPEMDGIAATRAIREQERAGGRHTPIIALTAHAMQGERERLLAAGLDDYLSKPFVPDQLCAVVARWAPDAAWAAPAVGPLPQPVHGGACDLDQALQGALGDETFLREMVRMLLDELPSLLDDVRTGLAAGDLNEAARAAHRLKGAVGNFHAEATMDRAKVLEQACAAGDASAAQVALSHLELESARLAQELERWMEAEAA